MYHLPLPAPPLVMLHPLPARLGTESAVLVGHTGVEEPGMTATDQVTRVLKSHSLDSCDAQTAKESLLSLQFLDNDLCTVETVLISLANLFSCSDTGLFQRD